MKKIVRIGTLCVALTLTGCGGTGSTNSAPNPAGSPGASGAEPTASTAGALRSGSMIGDRSHYESVVEMLRGRVPGLEIIEVDGGSIQVRIRGVNQSLQTNSGGTPVGQEPLVVVDGIPQGRPAGEVLMALNPKEVSSIDVLKDVSSTAVYGTRGANGVIIVRMVRRS